MIDANDRYSMMDAGNIRRLQESIARLTQERDALAVALAVLAQAIEISTFDDHTWHVGVRLESWQAVKAILAAAQPAVAGVDLLAAADQLADAVQQWLDDPDVDATQEETDLLGEAYGTWINCRARAGQLAAGPGREGE